MIYAADDDDNDYNDEDDHILELDKVALSPLYPGRIESWGVGLSGGRKTEKPDKNSRSKEENKKQTEPAGEVPSGRKRGYD